MLTGKPVISEHHIYGFIKNEILETEKRTDTQVAAFGSTSDRCSCCAGRSQPQAAHYCHTDGLKI